MNGGEAENWTVYMARVHNPQLTCGMSFLCAISRMRVSGTDWRNSPLMDGSRECIRLAAMTEAAEAAMEPRWGP